MSELLLRAQRAASVVFDDVVKARHERTEPSGVEVFRVSRRAGDEVTVSLNPNGLGAGVEWRSREAGPGYRALRLQGLVPEQEARP